MTIIATAVGSVVLAALPTSVGTAITGLGIGAGTVGAVTIGGAAAAGMGIDAAVSGNQAQQADKRQGAANAAVSDAVAPAAASMYSAPTAPISSGGQQYFATGGLTALAKGGSSVNLQDSDYIIPADVVSALGNGSSKAGARYLDEQFARLNSVGGVGALPESRKLMATRAKKKNPKAT